MWGVEIERDSTKAQAIRPSVSAVIWDADGRLLCQQRSDGGHWGIPGGSIEIGETVSQAVVREILEETGLTVTPGRLVGVYSDPAFQILRYPDGRVWHYVNLCFECRIVSGTLTRNHESLALGFFDPKALPEPFLSLHRVRVGDALARAPAPVIR